MSRKLLFALPIVGICPTLAVALAVNAGNLFAQGALDKATPGSGTPVASAMPGSFSGDEDIFLPLVAND